MGSKIRTYPRQRWEKIGDKDIYCRSNWEASFARYLQWLKIKNQIKEWEYEPQTFWFEKIKRGTRSYLPDFKVTKLDGTHYWVEVKGYMDRKSLTKIKRFKKYYPSEELFIKDRSWFRMFKVSLDYVEKTLAIMEKNKCNGLN